MSEEQTVTNDTAAQAPAANAESNKATDTATNTPPAEQQQQQPQGTGLFGESDVSEAELRGNAEPTPTTDKKEDNSAESDAKGEDAEGEEAGEDDGAEKKAPPKGYVPKEALAEERAKRKQAQEAMAELETKLAEVQRQIQQEAPQTVTPEAIESSEYSDEVKAFARENPKFAALILENSQDGESLRNTLEAYGADDARMEARTLRLEREREQAESRQKDDAMSAVDKAVTAEMDKLFGDGSRSGKEAQELISHLMDNGMSAQAINILTSPATIVTDGQGNHYRLGSVAYQLVAALKHGYDAHKRGNPDTLRAQIRKEVEAEVTRDVVRKMRAGENVDDGFQDIGSAPGHESAPGRAAPTTEDGWRKLSDAEEERLLRAK